jgi:hypothetical protein
MPRYQFGGGPSDIVVTASSADQILRFVPGATLTVWDSETEGSQVTDLQLTFGGEAVATLTASSQGRLPRFFGPPEETQLWIEAGDDQARYVINSTDIGALINGKLDKDAVPAAHTHTAADVPDVVRGLGSALAYVFLNTENNTWPARPDTSGPVVWIGNAERPGADRAIWGTDYVDQLTATGSTNIPDPTEDPDEDPDPITGIALSTPTASVNGTSVTLKANITVPEATLFAFVQIAVRGPGASDVAFLRNVTLDDVTELSATVTLGAGNFTAFATYNKTGGSAQSDWTDGPSVSFTVTPPAPGDGVGDGGAGGTPRVGLSGLPWNSGTFNGTTSVSGAQAFGTWRDTPIDALLTFMGRDSWGAMFTIPSSWAAWNGIILNSIPPQPQTANNSATAAGTNNQRWKDYGSQLVAAGLNRNTYIVRLGWESNGGWYKWSWGSPQNQNTPESFIAAVKNVSLSLKSTAPNVQISLNLNKGSKRSGYTWQSVFQQLVPYIDQVGLDCYDFYNGSPNLAAWNSNMLNIDPGLNSVAAFCRANSLQMNLEEWALIAGTAEGNPGGDNVFYITQMWDWLVANQDVICYEGYYDHDGAPSTLLHKITDGTKPNAAAAYRHATRWGGGN